MDELEQTQQNRRFWFYIVFTTVCMVISFWSGYRFGREVEKDVQLNPKMEILKRSS